MGHVKVFDLGHSSVLELIPHNIFVYGPARLQRKETDRNPSQDVSRRLYSQHHSLSSIPKRDPCIRELERTMNELSHVEAPWHSRRSIYSPGLGNIQESHQHSSGDYDDTAGYTDDD